MDRPAKNQSIFIKGVLSMDAIHIDDDDIVSTRMVVTTQDEFMGNIVQQYHNVVAIKQAALNTKDLVKGDGVYITGKLLWLESEYLIQSIEQERTAEVIALSAERSPTTTIENSYQMMVISGKVMTNPEYTASMTGAITRTLVHTLDKIINDAVEQSHNILAADKLAIQLKDFGEADDLQVVAQLLWMNSEDYTGDTLIDDRAVELVAERFIGHKNSGAIKSRDNQVEKNIVDLNERLNKSQSDSAAYIQSILNKINDSTGIH